MVMCLGVVSVCVIMAMAMVMRVAMCMHVAASCCMVVHVVMLSVVTVHKGFVMVSMALGVIVNMVVHMLVVTSMCLVMWATVAVVELSAQQVEFLLSLSSLQNTQYRR